MVLNGKYIIDLTIDWNKISRSSYLNHIDAIANLDYLPFAANVTFFVGGKRLRQIDSAGSDSGSVWF